MYDSFDSDIYFFSSEVTFLLEKKDLNGLIKLTKEKHQEELKENIDIQVKRDDLMMWNIVFARETIRNGSLKKYLHPVYNKYYTSIKSCDTLQKLQTIELDMINSYIDILINGIELTDNLIINKVIGYLHVHTENQVKLKEVADRFNISVGYLSTIFKKVTGMSVMQYLKRIKIDRAKTLLITTDMSLIEISTLLCFCNQGNFTKTFKRITGMTPTEYRNTNP